MRISDLARRTGTSTRMLRYYEQQGLLPDHRDSLGHRSYGDAELRLVQEILALQRVGFTLAEARPFVDCLRTGHDAGDSCPASLAGYQRKLADLDADIGRLLAAREQVRAQLVAALERTASMPEAPRCQLHATPSD